MSKTYFITGASSVFGHALAEAALARGDQVVVAARRTEALETLARSNPDAALAVRLDVTDPAAREQAVRAALERFGRVNVLANIVGRGSLGAAEEFTPSQLREQLELNFFAAAEMTRALLPSMRAQGSGHILNLPVSVVSCRSADSVPIALQSSSWRVGAKRCATRLKPLEYASPLWNPVHSGLSSPAIRTCGRSNNLKHTAP